MAVLFPFTTMYKVSNVSASLSTLVIFYSFDSDQTNGCEVVQICISISAMISDVEHTFSYVCWPFLDLLQIILCPFFNWVTFVVVELCKYLV